MAVISLLPHGTYALSLFRTLYVPCLDSPALFLEKENGILASTDLTVKHTNKD